MGTAARRARVALLLAVLTMALLVTLDRWRVGRGGGLPPFEDALHREGVHARAGLACEDCHVEGGDSPYVEAGRCLDCHEDTTAEALVTASRRLQDAVQEKLDRLARALAGAGDAAPEVLEALRRVRADRSRGVHAPKATRALLDEALDTVGERDR